MRRARLGDPNLELRSSFKGQQMSSMIVKQAPVPMTTTVTTGVIASRLQVDPVSLVPNWATRFQPLWEEYRVIKARAIISLFSSTNPGQINFWWDEKGFIGPPSNTEALDKTQLILSAGSNQNRHVSTWTAHDLGDLTYLETSSPRTPVSFQVYTDNANYGSSVVATAYLTVTLELTVQFRGYQD